MKKLVKLTSVMLPLALVLDWLRANPIVHFVVLLLCWLNVSGREALFYYENGKREPSLELLVQMSKHFNVSINYLITGEEFQKR